MPNVQDGSFLPVYGPRAGWSLKVVEPGFIAVSGSIIDAGAFPCITFAHVVVSVL